MNNYSILHNFGSIRFAVLVDGKFLCSFKTRSEAKAFIKNATK